MKSNLFIPRKIKVGFQNRDGTYTGKLAYVIYYDEKGRLRKEASWENWRNKDIEPLEYDNEPLEGFVLNKKVGGYACDWGNFRQAYVRVYDPRGFEFEITVPNLLYILEHTSSIKGKGLEGSFVYGWDGTDLVLIPTCSPDYASLSALNNKRFENDAIKAKDLKIGATYLTRKNERFTYMGRYYRYDYYGNASDKKKFFFFDHHYTDWHGVNIPHFVTYSSVAGLLIETESDQPAENYSELFEMLEGECMYSPHDPSKDEIKFYTADDLKKEYEGNKHEAELSTCIGHVQLLMENGKCRLATYSMFGRGESPLDSLFEMKQTANIYRHETVLVDPDEVIEKLHPTYILQYLANGRFYRRIT